MNIVIHTGYLKEGADLYTKGVGQSLVFFTLYVTDDDTGEVVPHKYRIERSELIERYRAFLTPGRAMTVHSKTRMVPVKRHDVTTFLTLGLEVKAIEFHSRAAAHHEDEAAPAAASEEGPLARTIREQFSGGNMGPAGIADAATGAAGGGASSRTASPAA
jgi:hypothetical protein